MFHSMANPAVPALCAALLAWSSGAATAATPTAGSATARAEAAAVAALQTEFIRRINHAEPVSGLFESQALIPDFSGLRGIALLQDKNATQAIELATADTARVRLRVQLHLQAPFSSDCPAVDAVLAQIGEDTRIWNEQGWMQISYRHSSAGWRITGLEYRPDDSAR